MKRLIAAALTACMFLGSAAAYQVPHQNDGTGVIQTESINNDAEAQAAMLHELGLFKGKSAWDYALNDPLTRAEAAVLLVRFLGSEEQANTAQNSPPFSDVPNWAAYQVGWLYERGLAKGVSATRYDAEGTVTAHQFSLFLSRMLCGGDERSEQVLKPDERTRLDKAGQNTLFVRRDAVALMTRVLTLTVDGQTMAQKMVAQGVFPAEQFVGAAWGVMAPDFGYDENGYIMNPIAGVSIYTSERNDLRFDRNTATAWLDYMLAYRENGEEMEVYYLDPGLLYANKIGTVPLAGGQIRDDAYLTTIDTWDYFYGPDGALLCRRDEGIKTVLDAATMQDAEVQVLNADQEAGWRQLVISTAKGQYVLDVFTQNAPEFAPWTDEDGTPSHDLPGLAWKG